MGALHKAHQILDFTYDVAVHGMPKAITNDAERIANGAYHLGANDAINPIGKIGQALTSPLHAVGNIARTGEVKNTLRDVYYNKDGVNLANIAGSAFTVGVGAGVVGGLTHDTSGNVDIAGIPMI